VAPTPQGDDASPDEFGDESGGSPGGAEPGGPSLPGFLGGFELQGFDLNQLTRILASSGPLNWEVAGQIATIVATGGAEESRVDPSTHAQLEELARAAQTHVVAETGLAATFAAPVRTVTRGEWATIHLEALRPALEALATTLGKAFREELPGEVAEPADPFAGLLPMLAPLLLGVQAGSMVGYLAQHALGRYDLPLPASDEPSLCFVAANLEVFETEWALDAADLRFYVAIHEVVHVAERSVPWVRQRLLDLAIEYVSSYEVDPVILESRLGDFDPSDPSSLQALAEHPEELLGAMRSSRQHEVLERARTFHGVLEGYADHVLERVGRRLIPSFDRIHEAMARHRIERGEAERFVEGLLGLGTGRDDYERGAAFCRGVVERAGPEALNRLWGAPTMAPTPNEIEAPGLWLARIDLDLEDESG
jgi:putative hydrolase